MIAIRLKAHRTREREAPKNSREAANESAKTTAQRWTKWISSTPFGVSYAGLLVGRAVINRNRPTSQ